jgi:hypothetical protein
MDLAHAIAETYGGCREPVRRPPATPTVGIGPAGLVKDQTNEPLDDGSRLAAPAHHDRRDDQDTLEVSHRPVPEASFT